MTLEELRALLAECARQMTELAGTLTEDRSKFSPDEQTRWDQLDAWAKDTEDAIKRHERVDGLARNIPAARESGTATGPEVIVRDDPFDLSALSAASSSDDYRSAALGAIEAVSGLEDRHREQAEHLVRSLPATLAQRVVLTGSPAYRSAFQKVVSGRGHLLADNERQALEVYERAASLTDASGGYAVPFTLDPTIIDTATHSTNPFRQISRVVQITTDSWNGVTSAGVTASWDGEAVEVSDDAPTLAQPSIPVFKGQVFIPFSVEIGGDWASIESDLRTMIQNSKDDLEGAAFAVGNGTSAPQGVVTALDGTASEIAPGTAETFAVGDVYRVENALKASARANASFVANKVWYNAVRAFDTAGGAGMWERIGAGQPAQLLGYPAYECSDMDAVLPDAAVTADNFGMILGDFGSGYVIVDRVGLSVELVPHLFHTANNRPNGQRGFYAWFRTGAEVVDVTRFAMLSIPTAA